MVSFRPRRPRALFNRSRPRFPDRSISCRQTHAIVCWLFSIFVWSVCFNVDFAFRSLCVCVLLLLLLRYNTCSALVLLPAVMPACVTQHGLVESSRHSMPVTTTTPTTTITTTSCGAFPTVQ